MTIVGMGVTIVGQGRRAVGRAGADILELVGQLHEGLADDDLWRRAVDDVCERLAVRAMLLGEVDGHGRAVHFAFAQNADQNVVSLVEGPLNDPAHNPWISLARTHPIRRIGTIEDVGGRQTFERTRLWNEVYRPYGLQDTLAGLLERQPEYSQILIMARRAGQPDFDSADHRVLAALLPHIARAWRVKRMLGEWKALAGTLKFVLDRLDRAVLVTGPEGEIRFANQAADRLLSRGDSIDATRGRLRAPSLRDTEALRLLIGRATRTGIGSGRTAVDAVAIRCADDSPPLAVVAEPLAPEHSDCLGHSSDPGAILFIGDSEASTNPSVERLRHVYGLTTAEARLASLIVQDHDLAGAARALGVSHNTVKYHLKTIFDKVGVTRQAQLVRRILADVGGLAEPDKMHLS